MKRFLLLSAGIFLIGTISAQWSNQWHNSTKNKHLLYANGDLMVGNSSGGNLGMTFVYDARYSVEVGYSATSNQFITPVSALKSTGNSEDNNAATPTIMMENFNIMAGRHFNLNPKKSIRFVLQGGPGMSVMMVWADKQPADNSNGYLQSDMVKTSDITLMINSKFEFPVTDLLGFSAGPSLIMNHDRQFLTFSVGFMYGVITKNQSRY